MKDQYIRELLDRYNPDEAGFQKIGMLVYYSYHDGAEYLTEQDIKDNEEDS